MVYNGVYIYICTYSHPDVDRIYGIFTPIPIPGRTS